MTAPAVVEFRDLLRDTRHMTARAASDLADWLVALELAGKADRSIYQYHRTVAALLRDHPQHELRDFTPADLERHLSQTTKRSRHITRSILNQWFLWAERKDRIDRNPMVKVELIKHPERRQRDIFSLAEVAKLEMDHLCKNTRCFNPLHVEPVTRQENIRRGTKARQTHCKRGHEFTPENTMRDGGTRRCRTCHAAKQWARVNGATIEAALTRPRADKLAGFSIEGVA